MKHVWAVVQILFRGIAVFLRKECKSSVGVVNLTGGIFVFVYVALNASSAFIKEMINLFLSKPINPGEVHPILSLFILVGYFILSVCLIPPDPPSRR